MSKDLILDISHHQPSNKINWEQAAKEVALCIIRVQYGTNLIDTEYKNHVANCKKYHIPFAHYAYGCFVSINDAIVEANDFLKRADKDALFLALDTEDDTVKSCGGKNLSKASQAFIDTLKSAGRKTGFYVSHHLYKQYGLDKVQADFKWIPRYGNKPSYFCDLWQYTDSGKVNWYSGNLDFSKLNGDKSLEWFLGEKEVVKVAETEIFKDVPKNNPIFDDTKLLNEIGVFSGYPDGTFRPNEPITRGQVASVVSRLYKALKK